MSKLHYETINRLIAERDAQEEINAKLESENDQLRAVVIGFNKLMDDIMPQMGKICLQDFGLLNQTLMSATEILKPK